MKILFISDIHYGQETNYSHSGGLNYVNSFGDQFDNLIGKIKAEGCDMVVNLGDSIQNTSTEIDTERYEKVMKLLQSFNLPIINLFGNHDVSNLTRDILAGMAGRPSGNFVSDACGYTHIVIDNYYRTDEGVVFSNEDKVWLENELRIASNPVIIYSHYPLDEQDVSDNYYFEGGKFPSHYYNRKDVRRIIENSGKVIGGFCGHLHFFHEENLNGIMYITIPSISENDGVGKPSGLYATTLVMGKKIETIIHKI